MADESPATKQDLQDLRHELKTTMDNNVQELKLAIEKVEATLLSEFWKWARTNDVKLRSITTRTGDVEERMALPEERVSELERRRQAS